MRATSLTVAALAAALLLTACDSGGDDGDTGKSKDAKAAGGCVAELALEFGPGNAAPAAGDTGNVPVTVTNRGDADCTLTGLPGVEFEAGGAATTVPADEAAGAAAAKQKTTLTKGATTSFTLTYVRGDKGLAVETAKVRLPGADKAQSFKWSYGEVALKSDGKTPDASLSGFQQAGD